MDFSTEIRVEFEDIDAGGVVYHPNYFRICERARGRWFAHFDADFACLKSQDVALAVRAVKAEYFCPVGEGLVRIEIKVSRRTEKSLTLFHSVFALDPRYAKGNEPNFTAEITLVAANYSTWRACPLPASILSLLESRGI